MKIIIKSLVPKSIRKNVWKLLEKMRRIKKSKVSMFPGNNSNILNCQIAYNEYGGYCTPISSIHRPAVQKILRGKIHEPDTIKYIISNCKDGDVIHAGTFFGDFLPGLSRNISNQAIIWAFEPNPENYRCALITMHLNALSNVNLVNAGLGIKKSIGNMIIQDENGVYLGGASKIVNFNEDTEKGIQVNIVSIDDTIPNDRDITIIQLDVEGYEKQALEGAKNTINRCKPIIILENLPQNEWLSKNILSMGYQISDKIHFNTVLKYKNTT